MLKSPLPNARKRVRDRWQFLRTLHPKNRRSAVIIALVITHVFSQFVYAQVDPSSSVGFTGDEEILFQDIPSVYGASKYEQKVTEAPSAVSIAHHRE